MPSLADVRSVRARPGDPEVSYITFMNGVITVPIAGPVALSNIDVPATLVLIVADLFNTDIVFVGGMNMIAANGQQLDPGRGWIVAVPELMTESMRQAMSDFTAPTGINYIEGAPGSVMEQNRRALGSLGRKRPRHLCLNLKSIFVAATVANQVARFIWFPPVMD